MDISFIHLAHPTVEKCSSALAKQVIGRFQVVWPAFTTSLGVQCAQSYINIVYAPIDWRVGTDLIGFEPMTTLDTERFVCQPSYRPIGGFGFEN